MTDSYLSGGKAEQPIEAGELVNKRVLLFLPEGFEDAEVACMVDVLGWTHYRPQFATVSVETAGFRREVRGGFGMRMVADVLIDDVDSAHYDAFVLPGGFHNRGFDEAYDPRVAQLAADFKRRGCPIATMCVGIVPLANAGLLEGGEATTYVFSSRHDNPGALRAGGCVAVDEPIVEWDGIISCSGPAHSEQVALLLLERLVGSEVADQVRRYRHGIEA